MPYFIISPFSIAKMALCSLIGLSEPTKTLQPLLRLNLSALVGSRLMVAKCTISQLVLSVLDGHAK